MDEKTKDILNKILAKEGVSSNGARLIKDIMAIEFVEGEIAAAKKAAEIFSTEKT